MVSQNSSTSSLPLEIVLETGEDNPVKCKRNRARVSCINCYASKRKCDRKRPCTRCINLGITGLCVYELDDPALQKDVDETTRLKNRIAELESVLRQLKRKPHPRWTAPGGVAHDPALVAARRGIRRHPRADHVRSTSVEAFFVAVVEPANREEGIKTEQESSFVPELTPSELEYPEDAAPNSHRSPRSNSTPFTFEEDANSETPPSFPPLTSFLQTNHGDVRPSSSSKSPTASVRLVPSIPSSTDVSTLSSLFGIQQGGLASDGVCHRLSIPPVSLVEDNAGTTSTGTQTSPVPSSSPENPTCQPSSVKGNVVCHCLNAATLLNPLLHLAIALQTSREALQEFHALSSDCDLLNRVAELEDHIFSATPQPTRGIRLLSQACDSEA